MVHSFSLNHYPGSNVQMPTYPPGRAASRTGRAIFAPYLFALMIATALVFIWAGLCAVSKAPSWYGSTRAETDRAVVLHWTDGDGNRASETHLMQQAVC
jgi:hypothetical protein